MLLLTRNRKGKLALDDEEMMICLIRGVFWLEDLVAVFLQTFLLCFHNISCKLVKFKKFLRHWIDTHSSYFLFHFHFCSYDLLLKFNFNFRTFVLSWWKITELLCGFVFNTLILDLQKCLQLFFGTPHVLVLVHHRYILYCIYGKWCIVYTCIHRL